VTLEYDGDTFGVELDMIDAYTSDMIAFFEEIADPDWIGTAKWQSEFAEITVMAARAGNELVSLTFSLRWVDADELDNTREGTLQVRAGALPLFAQRVRELTEVKGPVNRFRRG
jgi:hypothetical protein